MKRLMALALLPFFQFFRGTPHQLAAVKELEERMPQDLLEEEDNAWFDAWKASGIDQEVFMPYFSQFNNESGTGSRECFSSAAAMVAAFYNKVKTDDEYNAIRVKYGDTTSVDAQIQTLRSLGLNVEFRQDGDFDLIELEIERGRPVLAGYFHYGDVLKGEAPHGAGHWLVVNGYAGKYSNDPELIVQDPRGLPDMVRGGHKNAGKGRNARVRQSEFYPRWSVEGPRTGWVILVDDL